MIPGTSIPLFVLCALSGGQEGPRRTLIGRDLSRTEVIVERLDAEGVEIRDVRGVRRVLAHADVLALFDAERARPIADAPVLSLTDGQRLIGRIERSPHADETVAMAHPLLGSLEAPLDIVSSLVMPGMPGAAATPGADSVILANGDVVAGFVVEIGPDVVIEGDGGAARRMDLLSVASVRVSNPITDPSGPMVWLADGTVARVATPRSPEPGLVALEPMLRAEVATEASPTEAQERGGTPATVLDNVVGWMPDASRLVALARLTPSHVRPQSPRPWTDPPTVGDAGAAVLGAADIFMPGPCQVSWELPRGADGFTCVVSLPEAFRDWGDCQVVIWTCATLETEPGQPGSREQWRARLNAEHPVQTASIDLPAGSPILIVTVEADALGPIQDRPTISSAFVRIAPR